MDQRENSSAGTDLQNRRELERDLHNKPIKGDGEVAQLMEELIVRVVEEMERLPAHMVVAAHWRRRSHDCWSLVEVVDARWTRRSHGWRWSTPDGEGFDV
ncbi:hypothetical protein QJS04_geneDACA011499 [Acorus gramineus]|uniref:Uncharacterized protein n=1 Tax=Acorus gramineus TaxID=55184 RepID=A0AAV9A2T3_ACOGR|nr:hypothetical protein QJS04_geneDACA011499 [Acorus gramineus]